MIEPLYEEWLKHTRTDSELHEELLSVKGDAKAVEDRFYRELSFGTGGLRGVLGAGTNRMNVYSVGKATFGLAAYLLKQAGEKKSVAIAYDSRIKSREFAFTIAEIFSSKGIEAYIFDELTPTPVLSYAVRKLKTTAGIVITASHNPKEYNGYKVYNSKGCQITDEAAADITAEIARFGYFETYEKDESLIHVLNDEIKNAFLSEIYSLSLFPDCGDYAPKVVYTPLNGTGNKPVREILAKLGVKTLSVVPEQEAPDGSFATCPYPNPEEKAALSLALALAKEKNAELVLATDPDADRVGIAVRGENGEYRLFNGNETGVLLEKYILERRQEKGTLPPSPVVVKTIVTTDMATDIAKTYGAAVKEVLTGFKYIGEAIDALADERSYIMGLEESYGYLVGRHARDKDAVSACSLAAEAAAWAMDTMGLTLYEWLQELYVKYGFYREGLVSVVRKGKEGAELIQKMMVEFRANPPKTILGSPVVKINDFLTLETTDVKSGAMTPIVQDRSNVLQWFTEDGTTVSVRPSGTEPKIKFYFGVKAPLASVADFDEVQAELDAKIEGIKRDLKLE